VNDELRTLLAAGSGIVTRAEALRVVPAHVVTYALGAGHLLRLYQGVYADPQLLDRRLRLRAAVRYGQRSGAALSHLSALEVWGLWESAERTPVHLMTAQTCRLRGAGLVVHRANGFTIDPPHVLIRQGLPVTSLERSVVDSWPILPPERRREPVIRAVAGRRTRPARLRDALRGRRRLSDRTAFTRVLDLLDLGCHSPLEIWGHEHVFTGPGMPEFGRQVPIKLGSRTVYLDLFAEEEMVNFELDGWDGHGTRADRERDLRRDAALARLGILVVRFTRHRLVNEPEVVRQEVLAILAARRVQPAKGATGRPRTPVKVAA
jgi:very-short-patch-repair endonuclease